MLISSIFVEARILTAFRSMAGIPAQVSVPIAAFGIWLIIVWLPILLILGIGALLTVLVVRRLRPQRPTGTTPDLPVEAAAG